MIKLWKYTINGYQYFNIVYNRLQQWYNRIWICTDFATPACYMTLRDNNNFIGQTYAAGADMNTRLSGILATTIDWYWVGWLIKLVQCSMHAIILWENRGFQSMHEPPEKFTSTRIQLTETPGVTMETSLVRSSTSTSIPVCAEKKKDNAYFYHAPKWKKMIGRWVSKGSSDKYVHVENRITCIITNASICLALRTVIFCSKMIPEYRLLPRSNLPSHACTMVNYTSDVLGGICTLCIRSGRLISILVWRNSFFHLYNSIESPLTWGKSCTSRPVSAVTK